MCGIAGFSGDFDEDLLRSMNAAIAYRGPDDSGIWVDPGAGLGLAHRRLSIIDLSELGHQPMWDATRTVVVVLNGEIFNYQELRAELVEQGHEFRSCSDTEVLLNLYLREGEAMLPQLNGMFAFALWDSRTNLLFLARDGVGVKPLYYSCTPKGFLFASELKAILREPTLDRTLDPLAIHYHLSYLWCPAPHTMLKAVRKLEPGHALLVKDGKIQRHWQFYDLPYSKPPEKMSKADAVEELDERLQVAVRRQMVSDVPVGAFLSGGLDSSAVVSLARQLAPDHRLQCFTMGFEDSEASKEEWVADLPYARRVAKHLQVDLHTINVGHEMADDLARMIYHLDEPQADLAPINVLMISRLARRHGIKVLLSGAGGDDIFTGYRRHFALRQERYWSGLPRGVRRLLSLASGKLPVNGSLGRRLAKAFRDADMDSHERIAGYFCWIDPTLQRSLYTPELQQAIGSVSPTSPLLSTLSLLPAGTEPINSMLYLEGKHFLPDHNLNYTDKMSMAAGVEVRVPLLDPDLIAFASRLPVSFKQRGRTGKWIFKKQMEPYLPRDVIYRPKTGFGVPLRYWLRNQLKSLVDDALSTKSLERRGLFDPAGVQRLQVLDQSGRVDAAYTILALVCIETWMRIFIDGQFNAAPFSSETG